MPRICDPIPIGTTKRQKSSPTKKLAMHERQGGLCPLCNRLMRPGEKTIDEHGTALGLGGSNDAANRYLAHAECAYAKTYGKDGDLARIAKAKAQKRAALGLNVSKRPLQGRGFAPAAKQTRASAPIAKLAHLPRRSFTASAHARRSEP